MKTAKRVVVAGVVALTFCFTGAAQAADAVLYEVSEAVKLDFKKGGAFKKIEPPGK